MTRIWIALALAVVTASCAPKRVRVRRAAGDQVEVELVVNDFVDATFSELVHALIELQGRPRGYRRDCAFFLEVPRERAPIRVWSRNKTEVEIEGADLGLTPVCGAAVGDLITRFLAERGVVFYSMHGRVSMRPRGSYGGYGGDAYEVGDSMDAAFQRAVELTRTPRPSIVYEADTSMLASDTLRTAAELVRRGAAVLIIPIDIPNNFLE
ncbi:MAG: hypothetical protein KBG48_08785 [Kofleriaceae bacterium]|nr:hypothetical protein [Kofleriaceae bacterium]MBP9167469.1 hypothetical protein [Kofleriaceae bacterium]MBP9861041.1 hypothetical protein [Kofleriaceae bacterium]